MKKELSAVIAVCFCLYGGVSIAESGLQKGEAKFKEHCALCHPDGGNIVNPAKTLHKKDREKNHVMTETDILKLVRNPGPGMTKFDKKSLSDADAKEIAEYIIQTFK